MAQQLGIQFRQVALGQIRKKGLGIYFLDPWSMAPAPASVSAEENKYKNDLFF
jgi:hypothetical protein